MNRYQIMRLKERLYSRIPLIGRWLQQRTARELARDASGDALEALAYTIDAHPNKKVQAIARQAIENASRPTQINGICQAWSETRSTWLGQQIRQHGWVATTPPLVRMLSALLTGKLDAVTESESNLIEPLLNACQDADPWISQNAHQCLRQLHNPALVDAFCALWAASRAPFLEEILLQSSYQARRSPILRMLTALKVGNLKTATHARAEAIPYLLQATNDPDAQISERAHQSLRQLHHPETQDALCQLAVETGNPLALQVALQAGYAPSDLYQRAMFYFLTSQWPAYLALDLDQRVLRSAYETASSELRQRILEQVRQSGRAELLAAIASRRVVVHSPQEADFLVRLLSEQGNWERLWAKIFEFPLTVSVQALRILSQQNWQPNAEDECIIFAELTALAQAELELSPANLSLPPAMLRARVGLSTGSINELAFAPRQPWIAVGSSGRKMALWDFQRAQRVQLLGGFAHSLGEVAYTNSGELLVAERTQSHEICQVYHIRGDQAQPIWQLPGSITALEPLNETHLLVAGRDLSLNLLEVNQVVRPLASCRLKDWARAIRPAPDGKSLAALHKGVDFLTLPELQTILDQRQEVGRKYWSEGIARCADYSPDGRMLIVGKFDGQVIWLPVISPSSPPVTRDIPPQLLVRHPQRLQNIKTLPRRGVIISLDASGQLCFTNWQAAIQSVAAGKTPSSSQQIISTREQANSLHISPDESFMAIGSSDASLSLWDLRVLDALQLFHLPLANGAPNHLAALRLLLGSNLAFGSPMRSTLTLLERLLRHRFRFDIEVSDLLAIQTGEYDIEIE